MATSNWKGMYQGQFKRFQSTLAKAISRGYNIEPELMNLQEAKGGYKRAYENLRQYDLNYFKRQSRAIELKKEHEYNRQIEQERRNIRDEMERLYRDTYESITGKSPESIPTITYETTADDVMSMIDQVADSTMASDVEGDEIIAQAYDLINDIQAYRELRYRAKKALDDALTKDREKTVEALVSQKSDVITTLQRGKDLWYNGTSVEKDEEGRIWLSEWMGILENVG